MIPLSAFGSFFAKRPERAPGGGLVPAARLSSEPEGASLVLLSRKGRGFPTDFPVVGCASLVLLSRKEESQAPSDVSRDEAGQALAGANSPDRAPSSRVGAGLLADSSEPANGPAPTFPSPSLFCRQCCGMIDDPVCIPDDEGNHIVTGFCRRCGVATNRVIQPLNSYRLDEAAA